MGAEDGMLWAIHEATYAQIYRWEGLPSDSKWAEGFRDAVGIVWKKLEPLLKDPAVTSL